MIYNQFIHECNTKVGLKFIIGGCAHREFGVHDVSEAAFQLISRQFPKLLDLEHEAIKQIYMTHNQVVYEHVIPVNVIYSILKDMYDKKTMNVKNVKNVIDNVKYAVITKEEDMRLNAAKVRSKMPEDWKFSEGDIYARYDLAKIKMHEWK